MSNSFPLHELVSAAAHRPRTGRLVPALLFAAAASSALAEHRLFAQQPPSPEAPARARTYAPKGPTVGRPWLGVGLETRLECRTDNREDCRRRVLISSVVIGSPAEEGGIEVGDVVVALDGHSAESEEFQSGLKTLEAGRPVQIEVARGGETLSLDVVPRPRPRDVAMQVRGRPTAVSNWGMPDAEFKLPIVVEMADSTGANAWAFEGDGERHIVIAPSPDGWRVHVVRRGEEGERDETRHIEVELREMGRRLVEQQVDAERVRAYAAKMRAELSPELRAYRDSVLSEARARLADVRKARTAYRAQARAQREARAAYAPTPYLAEATRRLAGAEFEPLGSELSHQGLEQGLLVLRVIPGTPAHDLGLRRGDVVIEVGGSECEAVSDLREALDDASEGQLPVKWVRKGEVMSGVLNE